MPDKKEEEFSDEYFVCFVCEAVLSIEKLGASNNEGSQQVCIECWTARASSQKGDECRTGSPSRSPATNS